MATKVLTIDADSPSAAAIAEAAQILRGGGLVAFPTETVYGLGAQALDEQAVAGIFAAKGRPPGNPLIVHVASALAARDLAADWPDRAARLAVCFWPGPLTMVVKKSPAVPDIVTAAGPTVAVRVPAHKVALALLEAANVPIAAPSANRSSRLSPTRAEHVLRDLDGRIDLLLDAGPTAGGLESTVLDVTVTPPRLLRPGLVTPAEIEAVVGAIKRPQLPASEPIGQPLRSPGLIGRHYSPRTSLECVVGNGRRRVEELVAQGLRVGWITFAEEGSAQPEVVRRIMPQDPTAYAAELYAVLHELDAANLDRVVLDLPPLPPTSEAWLAVRDRLARMSAGRHGPS